MPPLIDLTHKIFGRLTVLDRCGSPDKFKRVLWRCSCTCGAICRVPSQNLRLGKTSSCGCLNVEKIIARSTTHGATSHGQLTKEYRTWRKMKERCCNKNHDSYAYYGGRGIRVCDRWLSSFEMFLEDMGTAPSDEYSIDRVNNNGHYEPSNCRWATAKEQANNRSKL